MVNQPLTTKLGARYSLPSCLEAERVKYAIRIPTNQVLQNRIGYLLKRPVGRPPNEVRRYYANFTYQAASWTKPRRVIAKVEWHPGELVPRVGFIVTNMSRPAERVVAFNRGTTTATATSASMKRSIAIHSTATDGRSTSKCQAK